MQHHRRTLVRLVAGATVAIALAACGGGTAATTPTQAPAAAQVSAAPVATDVAASAEASTPDGQAAPSTGPTSAPDASLDLPDLSGVATDLNNVDIALAGDASAATAEGTDK